MSISTTGAVSSTNGTVTMTTTGPTTNGPTGGTTGGASSLGSTISPAVAPTTDSSWSAQISACIANIFKAIQGCLAKLPWIGSWFESTNSQVVPPPIPQLQQGQQAPMTNTELYNTIITQFIPHSAQQATGTSPPILPTGDVLNYILDLFNQITDPSFKIAVFQHVLNAANASDDIVRQFYNRLPEGTFTDAQLRAGYREVSRNSLKFEIFIANSAPNGSSVYQGVDYGPDFGDHIIAQAIRGPLVRQAALNIVNSLFMGGITATGTTATSP
jgi:hypothetical protein